MKELIVKLSGVFGFDLVIYNEIVHQERDFIFRKKKGYYLALRMFLYAVILMMAISFIVLFAVIQNHQNVLIPVEGKTGSLRFLPAREVLVSDNWIHLLFGIIYLIMVYKTIIWIINLVQAERGHLSERKRKEKGLIYANVFNLLYSFDYAFMWYIIIICAARLSLDFTIGHYQVVMNPHIHSLAVQHNIAALGNAYWIYAIHALYFVLIITTCMLVVIYMIGYLIKPELKQKYIEKIKEESIFYITKSKVETRVKDHHGGPDPHHPSDDKLPL